MKEKTKALLTNGGISPTVIKVFENGFTLAEMWIADDERFTNEMLILAKQCKSQLDGLISLDELLDWIAERYDEHFANVFIKIY